MILAVAVIEARGPGVVKAILGVELSEIGIAIGNIKRFIEAGFAIDVNRMAGIQIEDSAAIKGGAVVAVRIDAVTVARSPNQVREGAIKLLLFLPKLRQ